MLALESLELLHDNLVLGDVGLHAGNWGWPFASEQPPLDLQVPGGVVPAGPRVLLEPALGDRWRWQGVSLEVCDLLDVLEHSLAYTGQPWVPP